MMWFRWPTPMHILCGVLRYKRHLRHALEFNKKRWSILIHAVAYYMLSFHENYCCDAMRSFVCLFVYSLFHSQFIVTSLENHTFTHFNLCAALNFKQSLLTSDIFISLSLECSVQTHFFNSLNSTNIFSTLYGFAVKLK